MSGVLSNNEFFYLHLPSRRIMDITFHNPRDSLHDLALKLANQYDKIQKEFTTMKEDDIRKTVYTYSVNTVESVLFSLIFEQEQLQNSEWYKKTGYIKPPTISQIRLTQENYDAFLRVAFVTEYFACFEIFFRILAEKLIPSCKNQNFSFICKKLLQKLDLENYQIRFDLFRFIRNSLHNNGIVNDPTAYKILYNGRWYNFELGSRIQIDWLMLCQLSAELHDCLDKITHLEQITEIDYIKDPSFLSTNFFGWHFELK